MTVFPDTSFLCALYVRQVTSERAIAWLEPQAAPLSVSSLLLYEFRQSVQFQIFRHEKDRRQGYRRAQGQAALAAVEWADVHQQAERLALQYTRKQGHRSFDILHVATALHLGVSHFLTFDANQKRLAEAEGLRVPV